MHDPTKVLMGTTSSSAKDVSSHDSDPATFPAGTAVSMTTGGALTKAISAGPRIGVSLGKSLTDKKRTAVVRSGESVPVLLTDAFTPVIGAQVYFSDTTGLAAATGTLSNAIYVSGVLDGVLEDGTTARAALIDMPGGL